MSEHCAGRNAKGEPCKKWAKPGSEFCDTHSDPEGWLALSRRGGETKARRARERAELRDAGGNKPYASTVSVQRATDVIHDLLNATVPVINEPDYEQRAYGALALATIFRFSADQKDEILALLSRVQPALVTDPHTRRLLDFRAARRRLLDAYEAGRISTDELPPGALELNI